MYTNVNLAAPVGALLFLGTAFLLVVVVIAFFAFIAKRKFGLAKAALGAFVLINVGYLVILLLFSATSRERLLARGEEKHFCEIDCHLAYSISDVQEAKTLGAAPNQITAAGTFHVVTIKTHFDERTISSSRGNELLYPNSRVVSVSDENGNQYFPSTPAHAVLEKSQQAGTAMTIPLRPGESYSTTLVFDLPPGIKGPALLIKEGESLTHFVIGHENSPLHKKTRFLI
ncbi:MAG TPA: hypothetical protein VLL54_07205 [Pyrinomonadaceae bacterium]|nr:hypothetical protein [Pyrinomonadaceae bacterium]